MSRLSSEHVDVLVVGAGPAGLSAAIVMAEHGFSVLVCERDPLPVEKVCGEGLLPETLRCLDVLGVRRHLASLDHYPFAGIRFRSPGGYLADARFAEGPGWGTNRRVLSEAFRRRAGELAKLRVQDRAPVRLGEARPDGIAAVVRDRTVTARLVVGADGLRSAVRTWAGITEHTPGPHRLGARQHFACAPWSEFVEVTVADGVEAYVTPSSPSAINVAFLWDPARYRAEGGAALIPSLLRAFPDIAQRLRSAEPLDAGRGTGPLRRKVSAVVSDGTALIGDAAGYYDACTGEGIGQAIAQALSFTQTVVPCLRACAGVPRRRDLAPYARAHRRITRHYTRATRVMMFAQRRPSRSDRVTRAAARMPEAVELFLSYLMGVRSGWGAVPRLPRLLVRACGRQSGAATPSPEVIP